VYIYIYIQLHTHTNTYCIYVYAYIFFQCWELNPGLWACMVGKYSITELHPSPIASIYLYLSVYRYISFHSLIDSSFYQHIIIVQSVGVRCDFSIHAYHVLGSYSSLLLLFLFLKKICLLEYIHCRENSL
jgi:hypothetical protein